MKYNRIQYKIKQMTKLSVNINKVATLRNARGGNVPDVVPDERHIRYKDVFDLKPVLTTDFNIEGNPVPRFVELVKEIKPAQVTLVPDAENVITSNAGWDTVKNQSFLAEMVAEFKSCGIRVSIFIDPEPDMIEMAARTGTDRVELYTEAYARQYPADRVKAIAPYVEAATVARQCGLGLNAGHDLSLENLQYFHQQIYWLDEVSIGHAIISDALYLGIEETIHRYLQCLR